MKPSQVDDLDTKQLNRLAVQLNIPGRSKMTQPELREVCKSALVIQESLSQLPLEPQGTTQDEPEVTQRETVIEPTPTLESDSEANEETAKKSLTAQTTSATKRKSTTGTGCCKSCSLDLSSQFDDIGLVSQHFGVIRTPKRDGAEFVRYWNNCKSCCAHKKLHGAYPTPAN